MGSTHFFSEPAMLLVPPSESATDGAIHLLNVGGGSGRVDAEGFEQGDDG